VSRPSRSQRLIAAFGPSLLTFAVVFGLVWLAKR
jgi:hypothetical protein